MNPLLLIPISLFHLFFETRAFWLLVLFVACVILRFIHRVFVKPWLLVRHYKSQGIKTCFFPGLNPINTWDALALKHGNCLYPWIEFVNKNPDAPAFLTNLGPFVHLQLVDPNHIKEFFNKEFECYKKGIVFKVIKLAFDDAITVNENYNVWKARRRIYSQAFHFEFLRDNLSSIEDVTIRFCNDIHPSKLDTLDIFKASKHLTGVISGSVFFGEDMSNVTLEGESVIDYLSDFCETALSLFKSPLIFVLGPKIVYKKLTASHREMLRKKRVFREFAKKIIEKKEQEMSEGMKSCAGSRANLLEIFIKAKKEDPETRLDNESIASEFMIFFFGGVDTTAQLISHSCYFIAKYPEITKRLREEIRGVWSVGKPLTMEVVNKLEYLNAFIKEVNRYVAISFITAERVARKDHNILGIKIKKGTTVAGGFKALSSHPKYYKNAHEFDPDRFLRKDPEEKFNTEPFVYLPFSSGRRNCIGQHLAILEAKVALVHLLMRYVMSLPKNYQYQLHIDIGFLIPMQPLKLKLKPLM